MEFVYTNVAILFISWQDLKLVFRSVLYENKLTDMKIDWVHEFRGSK